MRIQARFHLLMAVLLAAANLPLSAQDIYVKRGAIQRQGRVWVQQAECRAPVQEGARLVARTDLGSMAVKPGRADRMECRIFLRAYASSEAQARRILGNYELSLRRLQGRRISLKGRLSRGRHAQRLGVEYEIRVPERFHLDLQTTGGDLTVEGLRGELQAITAGGDIRAGDVTGPVRAETAAGGIHLGNVGQRLEARTAGGSIRVGNVGADAVLETGGGEIVAGQVQGSVRAATAGGDVVLRGAGRDVVAQTHGGQIQIGQAGGAVQAQTAGGSIQLDAAGGPVQVQTAGGCIYLDRVDSGVQAATVAGKIRAQITASRDNFRASALQSAFGDVEVYLPSDLPLTIDALIQNAAGHKILSDFPLQIEGSQPAYRFGTVEGRAALNGGGALLRIRTTAGNIEIRKLDASLLERLQQRQNSLWKRWLEEQRKHDERRQRER